HKVADALNDESKAIKGSRVLLLGMAYKPDVHDTRESPSLEILRQLVLRSADVVYADPWVDFVDLDGRRHERVEWSREEVEAAERQQRVGPRGGEERAGQREPLDAQHGARGGEVAARHRADDPAAADGQHDRYGDARARRPGDGPLHRGGQALALAAPGTLGEHREDRADGERGDRDQHLDDPKRRSEQPGL